MERFSQKLAFQICKFYQIRREFERTRGHTNLGAGWRLGSAQLANCRANGNNLHDLQLELYLDENASDIDAPDMPFHQVFYGQLLYIVKVTLRQSKSIGTREFHTAILGFVQFCKNTKGDAAQEPIFYKKKFGHYPGSKHGGDPVQRRVGLVWQGMGYTRHELWMRADDVF